MSANNNNPVVEIDEKFYEEWMKLHADQAVADADLIIYTDGLSVLEKKIMQEVDEAFAKNNAGKRLPEYLQRRDAKSDSRYADNIRAKAKAAAKQRMLRGAIKMKEMQFEEWRTRSANRRYSI
jgi:hypothetical protein